MSIDTALRPLLDALSAHSGYMRMESALAEGGGPVMTFGLGEAHRAHVAAALHVRTGRTLLIVTANEANAARLRGEIAAYGVNALHFPANDMLLSKRGTVSGGGIDQQRMAALCALCEGESVVVCASMAALMQSLAPPEAFVNAILTCRAGEILPPARLLKKLVDTGYERVDICESRGQVCLRGGYVDVYPVNADNPTRIEFFDDEIDTLREYDPLTQRSIENAAEITVPPAGEAPLTQRAHERAAKLLLGRPGMEETLEVLRAGGTPDGAVQLLPFFYDELSCIADYLPSDAIMLLDEPARAEEAGKLAWNDFTETLSAGLLSGDAAGEQQGLMHTVEEAVKRLDGAGTAVMSALTRNYAPIIPKAVVRFDTRAANRYKGDALLKEDMTAYRSAGYAVLICAGTHAQRMHDRLMDMDIIAPVEVSLARMPVNGENLIAPVSLARGFEYPELKLTVITEAELFGDAAANPRRAGRKRPQLAFNELSIGDLVVHELHGIARFTGVETLEVAGVTRDYLLLSYACGDKLYVPTDQLDRVQRYVGGDEAAVKLSRLGGDEWQKTVARTRESVKALAFDLVKLYGERAHRKGHSFSADTSWQARLEEDFQYEETPDQLACIAEIKRDMESDRVMDRLLCGDVGYGKTEVALRAAFKAVMDGKQVAFLVPTTILAQQHYNTLSARFSQFPANVALLSRFKTAAEQKRVVEGLASGEVDVVIGTHMLLGKSVEFRDLGLLIIDEEQRFGVGHKELIKSIKKNVDVLSLSATPIPRTLHMSMTGIRDMSVIETPPEQRYPVQTYVMEYTDAVVREAILKEIGRGGQVYFVYNRVRTMESFASRLRALVPEARIAYAHGQMNEHTLERTMMDFMEGQYDVLLCSTIIENGLDIQNTNTLIVYDADYMGLSQLYQLRGRVGRGARLGYAYLTYRRDKLISETAEKRLSAIREFTQFGSGFKIAMRDLEIRGAGNILGPEQHGHMQSVGYDLYCKLVDSAMREAKGEQPAQPELDVTIDMPISACIQSDYIPREAGRLAMYKRIAQIRTEDDMLDVRDELIDRYGDIPENVENLLFIAKLKADCARAYVTRLSAKDGELSFAFDGAAPMNGEKLVLLVASTRGAQLAAGDPPSLSIRNPKANIGTWRKMLPQFVYTLCDCIDK